MKKLILLLVLLLSCCSSSLAMTFTVDDNSIKHYGVSTVIGLGTSVATMHVEDTTVRRVASGSLCLAPGIYKGLVMDSEPDAGDFLFNIAGCATGIIVFDTINIYTDGKTTGIQGYW